MTGPWCAVVAVLLGGAVLGWPRRPAAMDRLVGPTPPGQPDSGAGAPSALGPLEPDLVMELVACGLRAGLPVVDALASAGGAEPPPYLRDVIGRLRLGVEPVRAWGHPPPSWAGLAGALTLAEVSGAPAASVVTRAAADCRAERRERAELAAARLGVRLVLPLGLAVLPGFLLLSVAPIVLGLAESVLSSGG